MKITVNDGKVNIEARRCSVTAPLTNRIITHNPIYDTVMEVKKIMSFTETDEEIMRAVAECTVRLENR